jgi:hypothetical protein
MERERQTPPRLREPLPPAELVVIPPAVAPPPVQEWQLPRETEPAFIPDLRSRAPGAKPSVVNPALAQVLPLLRSPQGLRSAIVLQEIFDRPLSQRQRRGPLSRLYG